MESRVVEAPLTRADDCFDQFLACFRCWFKWHVELTDKVVAIPCPVWEQDRERQDSGSGDETDSGDGMRGVRGRPVQPNGERERTRDDTENVGYGGPASLGAVAEAPESHWTKHLRQASGRAQDVAHR